MAAKGNYISKSQCQKSMSSVNPEFLKIEPKQQKKIHIFKSN